MRRQRTRMRSRFPTYGYLGLLLIAFAEGTMIFGWEALSTWVTPVTWTGYILFMDAVVFRRKGGSLMVSHTRAFLVMLPLSVGFWLIFEGYNLFLDNWHYIHLPERRWVRYLGCTWSFATIMPAIFETAEFIEDLRLFGRSSGRRMSITHRLLYTFVPIGIVCLILPVVVPPAVAHYMAALVWAGFIFLLDPLNYLLGGESILRDWEQGQYGRFWSLMLSGLVCGLLWEFWNFWAHTKWVYTIPILGHIKLFEMPVVGFLGFPPFAVEFFAMYSFARVLEQRVRGGRNSKIMNCEL